MIYLSAWNSLGPTFKMSENLEEALKIYERTQELIVNIVYGRVRSEQPNLVETSFTEFGEEVLHMTDGYLLALKEVLRSDFDG